MAWKARKSSKCRSEWKSTCTCARPASKRREREAEPRQQWRGFLWICLVKRLMKQSERTPSWVWLVLGLIRLGIATYAAAQDGIVTG